MAESGTLPRGRGLRSVSAGMKPRRLIPTAQRRSSTASGAEAGEAGDAHAEVMTLRLLLQERTEQVERLQALVSEKRVLQRHDEALAERLRQYEEQLAQLEVAVRGGTPTARQQTLLARGEKGSAVESADRRPPPSMREIMDSVYQLRYEKHRLEGALAEKERQLGAVRAELQHAQQFDNVQELLPLTEVAGTNARCAAPPTQAPAVKRRRRRRLRFPLSANWRRCGRNFPARRENLRRTRRSTPRCGRCSASGKKRF
ncbi:uncharacterized protein Tco025E_05425 [Trypanosoma conorhini]|uniref:Uncharacterized protein n=1 Tax=Trypanosoma conorhini TaxID=83891 RepID=A0A3R7MIL8_9TRYP|nr:uncharacterized protein Tco025E_05425 [Trypanosoma conorhini]RNF15767.1 hypothetical protein Tco025E_05425 [Trypanosoma conorhini]